ncbi:hypothetical protein M758_2G218200 [Ceratodon purpureus]|nr:hypothetical protein M758_2G218200 [Ceratodon purpureus]
MCFLSVVFVMCCTQVRSDFQFRNCLHWWHLLMCGTVSKDNQKAKKQKNNYYGFGYDHSDYYNYIPCKQNFFLSH